MQPLSQLTLEEDFLQADCTWCGTSETPIDVSWRTVIPPQGEPGDKSIISGRVLHPYGKTPAGGVIVFVHHTNIEGWGSF